MLDYMRAGVCACKYMMHRIRPWIPSAKKKMQSNRDELKVKIWKETIASQCRWAEYAEELIGDWTILWEDSEADWQGAARVLAYKQGKIRYLDWTYGSCSGCDSYEDLSEEEVRKEFKNNVTMTFKDIKTFCAWAKLLAKTDDYKFDQFNKAISSVFKEAEVSWTDHPEKLESKITVLALLRD